MASSTQPVSGWSSEVISTPGEGSRRRSRYTYTPQVYLDLIEQYKNDPDALRRINAGIRSFEYNNSFWDDLSMALTGSNNAERLKQEYALNFDDFLKQVQVDLANRDYNSEQSKVDRLTLAGINPDLAGLDSASELSNMQPDETMPDLGSAISRPEDVLGNISGVASNIIQQAFSIASGFQSLKLNQQDLVSKELSNFFGSFSGSSDIFETFIPDSDFNADSWADNVNKLVSSLRSRGGFSKRTSKLLGQFGIGPDSSNIYAHEFLNSDLFKTIIENRRARRTSDMWSAVEGRSNSFFSRDFGEFLDNYNSSFKDYQDEILRLSKQLEKEGLTLDMIRNAKDKDYFNTYSGITAGEAVNLQNKALEASQEFEKAENDFWNGLLSNMPDGWFGKILTALVLATRAQVGKGFVLPSISSYRTDSSGSSVYNKFGSSAHGESSNRTHSRGSSIRF